MEARIAPDFLVRRECPLLPVTDGLYLGRGYGIARSNFDLLCHL